MLSDLCLTKTDTAESLVQYRNLLKCCMEEGYSTVAVNRNFCDVTLTPKQVNNFQPVQVPSLELSQHDLTVAPSKSIVQLSRATIEISEPRFLQQLNDTNKILSTYDLIAIKPKNEKVFHSICMEYDYYDLISFDMGEKIPFMLKRNPVYEAIRKGKHFQLCYSALFDSNKKRICLTNSINIIKATQGKNLIITSDTSSHIYHRSSIDLCSLLSTLGMSKDKALICLRQAPQRCLRLARNRKLFKGIIEIVSKQQVDKMIENSTKIQQQKESTKKAASKSTVQQVFKSKHMKKLEKMKEKMLQKQQRVPQIKEK